MIHPKKARIPNPGVLAVQVRDIQEKEMLLAIELEVFFTEPHYNGFPAVLVRLSAVVTDNLENLLMNGPAHRGEAIRTYLTTPNLQMRLVALPAYSPDFNPDEAIWERVREEVTANTCFGTATKVHEKVDAFFVGLAQRVAEVAQRCRRELQALADQLLLSAS